MNDYNLKGRRAIVTGGAQGFGYAITKRFLESGAEVIIWDIDQKAIDEALKGLSSEKCSYQIVDVTNFDDITKNIELSTKEKNIDIFVNNAGMSGKNTQVWNYPNDEWLKAQVKKKEYSSKSELINDLVRQARGQQRQVDWIAAKLEKAEKSGFTTKSGAEILAESKASFNG